MCSFYITWLRSICYLSEKGKVQLIICSPTEEQHDIKFSSWSVHCCFWNLFSQRCSSVLIDCSTDNHVGHIFLPFPVNHFYLHVFPEKKSIYSWQDPRSKVFSCDWDNLPLQERWIQLEQVRFPHKAHEKGRWKFRLHHTGLAKYQKYGSVVREEILPGVNVVWLFHPEVV